MRVGEKPELANVLKLCGNFSIAGIIEVVGEGLAMAEASGLGKQHFLDFVQDFYPAPPIVGYATRLCNHDLSAATGFTVELALKDVGHMQGLARAHHCPLPTADLVMNNLLTMMALGHGQADWGSLGLAPAHAAGLTIPQPPNF